MDEMVDEMQDVAVVVVLIVKVNKDALELEGDFDVEDVLEDDGDMEVGDDFNVEDVLLGVIDVVVLDDVDFVEELLLEEVVAEGELVFVELVVDEVELDELLLPPPELNIAHVLPKPTALLNASAI